MDYRLKLVVRVAWTTLRTGVNTWMRFVMDPQIRYRLPKGLKPPYLVISNHVTEYDGLVLTMHLKHLPVLVFDDVQKLNAVNHFIFTQIGVVFKAFGAADPLSIRGMIKARNAGRTILLYPEGEITWTGDSKPLEPNLVRLIKLLEIPVVLVKAKGGYAIHPKWAKHFRKGKSIFEYDLILTPEEAKGMDDDVLLKFLQAKHSHREIDWLKSKEAQGIGFKSKKPASGLEQLLFCCPACRGANCMKTDDRRLYCASCGLGVEVKEDLSLESAQGEAVFSDIREWASWQYDYWTGLITDMARRDGPLLEASSHWVKKARFSDKKAAIIGHGPVRLYKDRIVYNAMPEGTAEIMLSEIQVCHCYRFAPNQDNKLLIRTSGHFFIIDLAEPNSPALSWELAINRLRREQKQRA